MWGGRSKSIMCVGLYTLHLWLLISSPMPRKFLHCLVVMPCDPNNLGAFGGFTPTPWCGVQCLSPQDFLACPTSGEAGI